MTGFCRRFLLVTALTVVFAAAARGEMIFPVNDAGTGNWVFDQPSVTANGTVLHLAFVGNSTTGADASPDTRLYYAAVNGGADFTNRSTARSQVILTAPVAIDNGDAYTGARHPQIALRSATDLVIVFQAIPAGDTEYKLFRARVTIGNNLVTSQRVAEIRDAAGVRIPGRLTDPSFGMVLTDTTLRVAYSSFPSLAGGAPFSDVHYARVGLDNAQVVGSAILLTKPFPPFTDATPGVSPLPRLRLDGNGNSHIVWASDKSTGIPSSPTGIYYSMVKTVPPGVVDNLAIGATLVLSGGSHWGFPSVFLTASTNVWILAADEPTAGGAGLAGDIGITEVNPYAVTHDGNPVNAGNLIANTQFKLKPPGETVLSGDFKAYRPEANIDTLNRVHVAGYGFLSPTGYAYGRYYVMSLGATASSAGTTSTFASIIGSPVYVGEGAVAFATQLPGDYTRPAFTHFSGKSVNFWSGPDNVVAGARNLYVTSTFSAPDPTTQSGCTMVADPRRGEADRAPGAAVLLLPAAFLALRRAARKAFGR
jgi:hypothetical protein